VTTGNYFLEVGNIVCRLRQRVIFPSEGKSFPTVTNNVSNCFVIPQTIPIIADLTKCTCCEVVYVRFCAVYAYTLELIKYYLAIKVSSNAVRNVSIS